MINGQPAYQFVSAFIRDVGFPIFVALYLLTQVSPAIREFDRQQSILLENQRNGQAAITRLLEEIRTEQRRLRYSP